jgi:hypothetical protein
MIPKAQTTAPMIMCRLPATRRSSFVWLARSTTALAAAASNPCARSTSSTAARGMPWRNTSFA